jgi:hypothetical protein
MLRGLISEQPAKPQHVAVRCQDTSQQPKSQAQYAAILHRPDAGSVQAVSKKVACF